MRAVEVHNTAHKNSDNLPFRMIITGTHNSDLTKLVKSCICWMRMRLEACYFISRNAMHWF